MIYEDVLIVSPGLLEAGTNRGGGIEVVDYEVGNQLSKYFTVNILSPFYKNYSKKGITDNLLLTKVQFPAFRFYPLRSTSEIPIAFFLKSAYSIFLFIYLILNIKDDLKLMIVHNGLPGLTSALVGKLKDKKILFLEGNLSPWVNPCVTPTKYSFKIQFLRSLGYFINLTIGKAICRLADQIITQSKQIRDGMIILGKAYPKKIKEIPIGVDIESFKPLSQQDTDEKNIKIGFIGRLTEEKGVLLLIDLIRKAQIELPEIKFIILGDGPYKEQLQSYSNVEYCCKVSRNELNGWLSRIHIAVFFQKELGLAELEAMASGKALIVCNSDEVSLIIRHLENGLLCEANVDSYMSSIKFLCSNKYLRETIALNARNDAVAYFSWENRGAEWRSICEKMLQ